MRKRGMSDGIWVCMEGFVVRVGEEGGESEKMSESECVGGVVDGGIGIMETPPSFYATTSERCFGEMTRISAHLLVILCSVNMMYC